MPGTSDIARTAAIVAAFVGQPRPLGEIRTTATLQTALATLRRSGSHLARLIDDNGETQAVIALEDILEELVGEVRDATRQAADTSRPDQTSF